MTIPLIRKRGCRFLGTEETGFRALLWSRVANGVWQLMVRQKGVYDRQQLYDMTRRIPWPEAMGIDQTLGYAGIYTTRLFNVVPRISSTCTCIHSYSVQCIAGDGVGQDISHTHYSALTVKNAIVDQFRDECNGRRPSIDTEVR